MGTIMCMLIKMICAAALSCLGLTLHHKTCHITTRHESYPGNVSFEYTYKLRGTEAIGIWMDVSASVIEVSDCEEKLVPIIQVELYSNSQDVRICKTTDGRQKDN